MPKAKCPLCGGNAQLVWESPDKKTQGIRCKNYHRHKTPKPTKWRNYHDEKTRKNMVFLVTTT